MGADRQCRRFEAPAAFAGSPCQELQIEKRHWKYRFTSAPLFPKFVSEVPQRFTNFGNGALAGIQPPETSPCGKSRIRICWSSAKGPGEIAVAEAALDDGFIDDITFPASDRYLLGATLFLPRGTKRHAVLINSATAVPRKIYRGFAGYLARRGCAVLTYDYRGTGDSRQKAMTGYNQLKSLVGFKASMSDWAAQDVTAAVAWMRARYKTLPFAYVGHSFGGQVLGLLPNNSEISPALLIAAQAGYWKLMAVPERYRVYAMLNFAGVPLTRTLGYTPAWTGLGMDLPRDVFLQWVSWVMSPRYLFDDKNLKALENFGKYQGALRALVMSD